MTEILQNKLKLQAKNIAPLVEAIKALPKIQASVQFEDEIKISFCNSLTQKNQEMIFQTAQMLKPWRKGPFQIGDFLIDSEWQSFQKWNLIAPKLQLEEKEVADIGCNNGYYMFKMLPYKPKSITGFDPYALFKCQFDFINHFIQAPIVYEMLGVEHLELYAKKFDVILCMGVLYHRSDPIHTLKALAKSLKSEGEVILDTLILDREEDIALCPKVSYAKMSNAFFIPTPSALQGWCQRAGFEFVECFAKIKTTTNEQRKTQWIDSLSLENFLNPDDENQTIEGYQAPLRGFFKLKRRG